MKEWEALYSPEQRLPERHHWRLLPQFLLGGQFLLAVLLQSVQPGQSLASCLDVLLGAGPHRLLQVPPLVPLPVTGLVPLSLDLQIKHLDTKWFRARLGCDYDNNMQ